MPRLIRFQTYKRRLQSNPMAIYNTPNCITLLQIISEQLHKLAPIFDTNTAAYKNFKENLMQDPAMMRYVQTLLLVGLSLHTGILMTSIQNITLKNDILTLDWGNQIRERFTFGTHTPEFDQFLAYFQIRVFGKRHKNAPLTRLTLDTLHRLIQSHQNLLTLTNSQIEKLKNPTEFRNIIEKDIEPELFFIIIGCLPDPQINALFLHIQSFFPDNLEIKTPDGNTININILLQSPSADIQYLLSKVRIYLELYYSPNLPIIKHITQSKTKEFLLTLTQNTQVMQKINENFTNIQTSQIAPRQALYTLFDKHLTQLLTA